MSDALTQANQEDQPLTLQRVVQLLDRSNVPGLASSLILNPIEGRRISLLALVANATEEAVLGTYQFEFYALLLLAFAIHSFVQEFPEKELPLTWEDFERGACQISDLVTAGYADPDEEEFVDIAWRLAEQTQAGRQFRESLLAYYAKKEGGE